MEPTKKSHGALIGSIIIIVILIIGGLYMWQQKKERVENVNQIPEEQKSSLDDQELNSLEQEANNLDSSVDVNIDQIQ